MRVLFATSEVAPFAKTGGLGDVLSALPVALESLGLSVAVVLPYYPGVRRLLPDAERIADHVNCPFAKTVIPFDLRRAFLPDSKVPLFLVECPAMFEVEDAIYGMARGETGHADLRFAYFARAVLRVPHAAGFLPDVFHLNDWPTGLIAPLLRTVHREDPDLDRAAVVMTIHNLAYQGRWPKEDLQRAAYPEYLLQDGRMLESGHVNFLAAGLRFADAINTVSETYAREIRTKEFGQGLEGLLDWRQDLLSGIRNGLDLREWDAAEDPHLKAAFSAKDLSGKALCKAALLSEFALEPSEGPLFVTVSRLTEQKGLDLIPPVIERVLERRKDARFVLLGSGDPALEASFRELAARFPGKVGVRFGFDVPLSHRIEAGADFFLMPSRFEPCGLNQMISMRYGTVPIVREVGGLKDTVRDLEEGATATGIRFRRDAVDDFAHAVGRALDLFDEREAFRRVQLQGMAEDFSWDDAALHYGVLYERAIAQRKDASHLAPLLQDLPREPLEADLPPLPRIPIWYPRDGFEVLVVDPHELLVQWEISGERSASLIFAVPENDRHAIQLEVELERLDLKEHHLIKTPGHQREVFAEVTPGGRYSVRLFLLRPHRDREFLFVKENIDVPKEALAS